MKAASYLLRAAAACAACSATANTPPALYTAGSIKHALRLPDGSVIIAGDFTAVAEIGRAGLAKLDPNGQVNAIWNPNGLAANTAVQVVALAASPTGDQVYIATPSTVQDVYATGTGANVPGFTLVTASGSVDGGDTGIRDIAVRSDGTLYLAGAFAYVDGQSRSGLASVSATGTLNGWSASANSTVNSILADSGAGYLYLGGRFVNIDGAAHLRLARVSLGDGSVDAGWAPSVTATSDGVHRLTLSAAGDNIVFAGYFTSVNSTARSGIARVSTASPATLDPTWNPSLTDAGSIEAIAAASDYVFLGGDIDCCNQAPLARVAATGAGALDASWAPMPDGQVHALSLDGTGALLAFGDFRYAGNIAVLAAAHIAANGSVNHALSDVERNGSVIA